jgi:hypothetical protein
MIPAHEYGTYGGRALRNFNADVPYIAQAEISAEQAAKWPIANRRALYELGKVEWYGPPEDTAKRVAAAPKEKAPAKEKVPAAAKEVKTPSARTTRRTK